MNRDRSLLRHHGLNAETLFWSSAHERYASRIQEAIESRRMTAVVGSFGSGKSTLVREALDGVQRLKAVYVNNPDRERLRVGHVLSAIVFELSAESPRRSAIALNIQLARIMGELVVNGRHEIVVVIENAHRLHHAVLMALKDLRESATYRGIAPLFSVVLVGQEGLRSKLERHGEVFYRTKTVDLTQNGWMSLSERIAYLEQIYQHVITPEARQRLALLYHTPLELDYAVEEKLEIMRDGGFDVLDESVMPFSIREQRQALKVSLRDLERESGVPKSTISDIEHNRTVDDESEKLLQLALNRIANGRKANNIAA